MDTVKSCSVCLSTHSKWFGKCCKKHDHLTVCSACRDILHEIPKPIEILDEKGLKIPPAIFDVYGTDNKNALGQIWFYDTDVVEELKRDRRFLMAGEYQFRRSDSKPTKFEDAKELTGIRIAACGSGTAIPQVQEVVSATE